MVDYNASPSSFGWNFQINAAIIFLLNNIKEVETLRVEGANEDIEVLLNNGKKILIQTKSYTKTGADKGASAKLTEGIRTLLYASNKEQYEKLYYVTNYPNPLGGKQRQYNIFMGGFYVERAFRELSEDISKPVKEKIIKAESEYKLLFDLENFRIAVIPFDGDIRSTRERYILEKVREFLSALKIDTGLSKELLEIWQSDMFFNSSQISTKLVLEKKQLIWPIVVLNCEISEDDKLVLEVEDEFDLENEDIEIILDRYKEFIDKKIEQFNFVTKVVGDYKFFKSQNKGKDKKISSFIKKNWKSYMRDLYSEEMEEELIEVLIRIILGKILNNQRFISKINQGVNL